MTGAAIAIIYGAPFLIVGSALIVLRLPAVIARRKAFAASQDWLACTCGAGFARCECAIDGARNPRGAGRGRKAAL